MNIKGFYVSSTFIDLICSQIWLKSFYGWSPLLLCHKIENKTLAIVLVNTTHMPNIVFMCISSLYYIGFQWTKNCKISWISKAYQWTNLSFPITIFYAMLIVCVLRLFNIINFTEFDPEKYDFNLYNRIFMWNKWFTFGKLERKRFQTAIFLW